MYIPNPQPMYYRNAQAAVVVYDVTKAASLEKAKTWVKELQRQANPNIVIALAGNKIDLVQPSPSGSGSSATAESEDEADDATATPGEAATSGAETENPRQVPREEAQAYAPSPTSLLGCTAKNIPIESILASSRGAAGRPGAAGNRPGTQEAVNLDENQAKGRDACNC
jgi:hypothetical protein